MYQPPGGWNGNRTQKGSVAVSTVEQTRGTGPECPLSLQEALADIDRVMTAIIRWYRALEPEAAADSERSSRRSASGRLFDLDQLPRQLRPRITDAIERLERVREAVRARWRRGLARHRPKQRGIGNGVVMRPPPEA
jgi:hypothetical protein